MTFVYPEILLLLVLVIFFYFIKKSSKIEQVFSKEMLEKLQFGTFGKRDLKFYLLLFSFVLIVISLARPVVPSQEKKEIDIQSFNFVIALDISKSMEAQDVFPNRLEFAKKAIYELMQRVPEANIAVIAYANDAFMVSPFSNDFNSIKFLLSNLDSNSLSSKGSQILSALEATSRVFESTNDKKKSLVLIGDGADGRDLEKIEKYIKQNNIMLHVLSIGTKKGSTLSDKNGGLIKDKSGNIVISKRDDSLSGILNGGTYLSSSGELSKLEWFVKELKNSVDKKEIKRDRFEGAKELFYYPLAISLFFIFFAFNSIRVPFLVLVFFVQVDTHAGIFDFVDIYEAKKSYENKEYKNAQKGFSKVGAKYNEANSLYKQKKYKEALEKYESIDELNGDKEQKRLHNIGNSYANLGKTDKAIKSYEEALKIKEDKDTRANLELMKKKKKEQEKKQKKQDDKKSKETKKEEQKKEKSKEQKDKKQENKKPDEKKQNQKDKKSDEKEQKNSQAKEEKEQKKMSEAEAKKWEKQMNKQKFKTKPMKLKKGEQNEIYW